MLLWTLVYMSFCKHKQPFLLEIDIQMELLSTVYMYFSHLIDKWQTSFQWLYQLTFHPLNNVTHIWCIYPLHFNPCNGGIVNPNFLVHVSMMANGTWYIFTCFWAIYLHCFVKGQFKVLAVCVCVCVCVCVHGTMCSNREGIQSFLIYNFLHTTPLLDTHWEYFLFLGLLFTLLKLNFD